jgi:hypothetical protein
MTIVRCRLPLRWAQSSCANLCESCCASRILVRPSLVPNMLWFEWGEDAGSLPTTDSESTAPWCSLGSLFTASFDAHRGGLCLLVSCYRDCALCRRCLRHIVDDNLGLERRCRAAPNERSGGEKDIAAPT